MVRYRPLSRFLSRRPTHQLAAHSTTATTALKASSREGFGSFHSEDIESLVRAKDSVYSPPPIHSLLSSLAPNHNNNKHHRHNPAKHNNPNVNEPTTARNNNHNNTSNTNIDHDPIPNSFQSKRNDICNNVTTSDLGSLPLGASLRQSLFSSIDPTWCFINHGAFGAVLAPLLDEAEAWRRRCESQPLRFYDRELLPLCAFSLRAMAAHLCCPADELMPLPNVTSGLNAVLLGTDLDLNNDSNNNNNNAVLCMSLTYGSTKKIIKEVCARTGAQMRILHVSLPLSSAGVSKLLDDNLRKAAEEGLCVKVAILDHITSNTALVLPVLEMARVCKERGVQTVIVDAAHTLLSREVNIYSSSPSSPPLPLVSPSSSVGALSDFVDVWITNGHKWLAAPKGVAFMWVHPARMAHRLRPAIISHGYEPMKAGRLLSAFAWDGCRDYAALLCTPSALRLWEGLGVARCRSHMRGLLKMAVLMLMDEWKIDSKLLPAPLDELTDASMALVPLPEGLCMVSVVNATDDDAFLLQEYLHHEHTIEVPVKCVEQRLYVRLSCHVYNDISDYRRLATAIKASC